MKLQINYPWHLVERGQGFFVPCLDAEPVIQAGLHKALGYRYFDARAKIGVKNGVIGVLFYRLPLKI